MVWLKSIINALFCKTVGFLVFNVYTVMPLEAGQSREERSLPCGWDPYSGFRESSHPF